MTDLTEFEKVLFDGILVAFRLLSLDELEEKFDALSQMDLPDEIGSFPLRILAAAISEKRATLALN